MSLIPQKLRTALQPITIITGHYGVGKTNFALNLAHDLKRENYEVKLVDLDIVNPYFRSSEYAQRLQQNAIELIAPVLANTSLDTPSLSTAVLGAIEWAGFESSRKICIIDCGGDDAGVTALRRFVQDISKRKYAMFYVINYYRNLTQKAEEALRILDEVSSQSKLRATGIINNSHMQNDTDKRTIENSLAFAQGFSSLSQLPLLASCIPESLMNKFDDSFYGVKRLVSFPWEK